MNTVVRPLADASRHGHPRPLRMLWVTLAWGSCFVAITVGLQDAPPLWLAALRALIAGVALATVAGIQRAPLPRDPKTWALIGCLGLVNIALAFATMFVAATGLSTGIASVLANAQPILILLPAWWLYRERPTPAAIAAIGLGFTGLLIIVLPSGLGTGAWLSLTSAAAITAGTLIGGAISAGANVKAVQRMLGHASAAMTLDTYADLFDDDLDLVAHALSRARDARTVTLHESPRTSPSDPHATGPYIPPGIAPGSYNPAR